MCSQGKSYQSVPFNLVFGVCFFFFFPVLNDGGPERLHVKGQAVPVWRQLIKTRCVAAAAALQFEVSCPQFMASFITAVCGENVAFYFFFYFFCGAVLGSKYLSSLQLFRC